MKDAGKASDRVEILLATWRGARYLEALLDSILGQRDQNWHLTASDDASDDDTPRILEAYHARYPERITVLPSHQRFGCARDHFFFLIAQCDAPYMMLCDQDDVWLPDKVGKTLCAIRQAEQGKPETPTLVFCDLSVVDASLRPIAPSLTRYAGWYTQKLDYRSLLLKNVAPGCAMGLNRALARLALQCDSLDKLPMHDGWLAAVAARFGRIVYLDEPLALYRQHGRNSVGAKKERGVAGMLSRLGDLSQLRERIAGKKRQAAAFEAAYAGCLTEEERNFLLQLARKRSGAGFYWRHRQLTHSAALLLGLMALG